eukprot:3614016-Rhodomonas_salina.1
MEGRTALRERRCPQTPRSHVQLLSRCPTPRPSSRPAPHSSQQRTLRTIERCGGRFVSCRTIAARLDMIGAHAASSLTVSAYLRARMSASICNASSKTSGDEAAQSVESSREAGSKGRNGR